MTRTLMSLMFEGTPDQDIDRVYQLLQSIAIYHLHEGEPELLRVMNRIPMEDLLDIERRLRNRTLHSRSDMSANPEEAAAEAQLFSLYVRHVQNGTRPGHWRNIREGDDDLLAGDDGSDDGTEQLEMQLESDLYELAAEQKAGIIKATLKITKGLFQAPKGEKVDYLLDAGWPYVAALVDAKGAEWLDSIIAKFVTPRDPAAGKAASAAAHAAEQGGTKEDFEAAWNEKRGGGAADQGGTKEDFEAAWNEKRGSDPDAGADVDDEEAPTEKKTETLTDGQLAEAAVRWTEMAGLDYGKDRRTLMREIMDVMPMDHRQWLRRR